MPKKKDVQVRPRANTPLLFLLLILTVVYGGFYNFTVLLSGVVLALLLVYTVRRAGSLRLPVGPEAIALYVLCGACLLSVPFAVSAGMAFSGFLRAAVWVLFFLCAATYTQAERQSILDTVAYEGAILSAVSVVFFLCGVLNGGTDANGRIDGPFEYANTWSLYLLVCLIILLTREKKRFYDWLSMASALLGIYLSGSRGVFLLLLVLALAGGVRYAVKTRRVLPLLLLFGGAAVLLGAAVFLSGGVVLNRLKAITLSSSSLNGRLLYALDGLRMIWEHPLGVGRGGYLYLQPLYQTGVYTLRFIHNEYLQAALDGGVLGGVCMAALVLCLLFRKGLSFRERAVIFAVAAHALIDFDFQFTVIMFLLLLCGSGGKYREIALPRRPGAAAGALLSLFFCYFSLAYFLDFAGQPAAAGSMFPADLSLAENKLQSCADMEEAEAVADGILDATDLSMLAWDCKFAACVQRMDGVGMARAKYQYLRLNKYRGEVYQDFAQLLENLSAQGSSEELQIYQTLTEKALEQMEEVEQETSPLAYRIVDKPELEFIPDVTAQLNQIMKGQIP